MSEGLIFKRGGTGGGQATGVCGIKASWPEGMSCTVSSGTKKIRAGKDATEWIFMLPFAGEWTVQAGELSQSVTVADGEIKIVSLSEGLRLLSNGVEINETLTGLLVGTTQKQSSSYTGKAPTITRGDGFITASLTKGSGNTSGGLMFNNTIDLSIYDTLHIKVTELTGAPTVWIGTSKTAAFNSTSTTAALRVSDDLVVDISSLSGLKAVGFRFAMTAAGTQSVTVADMWLTGQDGMLVLYSAGDQCEDVTGGWEAVNILSAYQGSTGTLVVGSGYIGATQKDSSSIGVTPKNAIDLSNYSTLHIDYTCTSTVWCRVAASFPASTVAATANWGAGTRLVKTLNISALSGEYRLGAMAVDGAVQIKVYNAWLT